MKTRMITWLVLCWMLTSAHAQDPNFSQFYEMPMLRNPALNGVFDCNFQAKAIYRNQWQSVTVPYKTVGASVEMKLANRSGNWHAIGLQLVQDVAGDSRLQRIQVLPAYTFHLQLQEGNFLSMGIMAGPVNSHFDPSQLTWNDQFVNGQFSSTNPTSQIIRNTNINYLDLNMGILFSRPLGELGDLYVGAAGFHLNNPVISFDPASQSKLRTKWALNGGLTVPSGYQDAFTLYCDLFLQSAGQKQFMMGAFYVFNLDKNQYYDDANKTKLQVGGIYRWDDAVIPTFKLDYGNFSFGLSYDVNTSKLKTASQGQGGFEFTLTYRNCQIGNIDNSLPCPGKNF